MGPWRFSSRPRRWFSEGRKIEGGRGDDGSLTNSNALDVGGEELRMGTSFASRIMYPPSAQIVAWIRHVATSKSSGSR